MQKPDFSDYSKPRVCPETDTVYRIRDDGEMIALFGPRGEEFLVALRHEDIKHLASIFEP